MLVEVADYLGVDISPLLERSIQLDLAEFAAQRSLCQLRNAEGIVADAVGGAFGIENFQIEHAVH